MTKDKPLKPFRVQSIAGGPVTVTDGKQSRDFYDLTVTGRSALAETKQTLLLRLDRAQMILLRTSLDALVPAAPSDPIPDKSAQH